MLGTLGPGTKKTGEAGTLEERVDGALVVGNRLAAEVPSGVLVGVSPVSVQETDKGAKKSGAEKFGLLHVLVVDDDEAVLKACCQIARGMGFALVLGADSATSARGILKHQRIDLLLLDLKLPGGAVCRCWSR
jgi:hypothetical protein